MTVNFVNLGYDLSNQSSDFLTRFVPAGTYMYADYIPFLNGKIHFNHKNIKILTFSMVYIDNPHTKLVTGSKQNMTPLFTSATMLKILINACYLSIFEDQMHRNTHSRTLSWRLMHCVNLL